MEVGLRESKCYWRDVGSVKRHKSSQLKISNGWQIFQIHFLLLAAICCQSTLLVHYNLQILLIISVITNIYRNFPDSQLNLCENLCYPIFWNDWLSNRYSLLFCFAKLRIFIEVIKPQFLRWNWCGASYGAESVFFQIHSAVERHLAKFRHGYKPWRFGLFTLSDCGVSGLRRYQAGFRWKQGHRQILYLR